MVTEPLKGRFAPTPSGRMHAGNICSALLTWLSIRSQHGTCVLRIEDLDPRAQRPPVADLLMEDLDWLGLTWDEGPYFQSQRTEYYEDAVNKLTDMGLTYPCFCTRSELHATTAPHMSDGTYVYPGTCRHLKPAQRAQKAATRPPATRLIVPDADDPKGTITFTDEVYGPQREVLATQCGDFLIKRSDGVFAYQLAVVVDDGLMGVTEVVRGHDLLGSCARQIYLQRLLGYPQPHYAHVPLLMGSPTRRLSKRDRDLDMGVLRERFGRPEPLIVKLASLFGLAQPNERLSAEDLIGRFSWAAIREHRADIVVNPEFLYT